jgi:hypothetical protein
MAEEKEWAYIQIWIYYCVTEYLIIKDLKNEKNSSILLPE